jgi:hypothetical protein
MIFEAGHVMELDRNKEIGWLNENSDAIPWYWAIGGLCPSSWMIKLEGDGKLPDVVPTNGVASLILASRQSWKEKTGQAGNDADHDQKLHQGETSVLFLASRHVDKLPYRRTTNKIQRWSGYLAKQRCRP